jgi:ParB/RepB/Spo0J family partition protein
METQGTLHPIIVQPQSEDFLLLIAGSRRFRAAKRKGLSDILATVIQPIGELEQLEVAFTENLHREDLNPFEEAQIVFRLVNDHHLGIQETARRVRKPEKFVRDRLQLISMPQEVQVLVAERQIGLAHLGSIARMSETEEQIRYAQYAAQQSLTPGELVTYVRTKQKAAGQSGSSSRRRRLTADKASLKLTTFASWVQDLPKQFPSIRPAEKRKLHAGLAELREAVRAAESALNAQGFLGNGVKEDDERVPRNHRDEWSMSHLDQIVAADRPSDRELSKKLGRTVIAIQVMRTQLRKKKGKGGIRRR